MRAAAWKTLLRARIGSRLVVASVSGGKDSAAMSLYLRELGIEHGRVFADTGWEHPRTYEYLRGELTRMIGPITEVRASFTLPELVRKKGMFPSRLRRFCTTELKVKPLAAFVRALGLEVVNAVGIRAAESRARAGTVAWEWSDTFDCDVWRPILHWSEADVIDIHRRHGLKPNPLYLSGASRVGCWPCINARKSEIRLLDAARVDEIRELEAEVQAAASARHQRNGGTFESLGFLKPSFFVGVNGAAFDGIDEVLAWAKTSYGGRQLEMFADAGDGCARWGLCESTSAGGAK